MKLSEVAGAVQGRLYGPADVEAGDVVSDSRRVKRGDIFVALPGHHVDGKTFIPAAVAAGASVIVADEYRGDSFPGTTWLVTEDPFRAMGQLSAAVYRHPDRSLLMVGITGTNGKTTTTYFIESIFAKVGIKAGVIGTINYRYGAVTVPAPNTTPQSADLFRMLGEMVGEGCGAAVMEVSSHALALGRVEGIEFDVAIFTNLTRDHMDFHGTMEEYFKAKSLLFSRLRPGLKKHPKYAIINCDDEWGGRFVSAASDATVLTYGLSPSAQIRAEGIKASSRGTEFTLNTPSGSRKIRLPHIGKHNIYNAMASAGAALAAGIPLDTVAEGLEQAPMVPGRLEKVEAGQGFTVVVDYAHTDDALQNVLSSLRELNPARVITVFGCGGDRDRTKRPLMGEVATALSDYVFVTSDNPRSENPERITLDIEVGIRRKHRTNYQVVLDREQAIASAISMARKGDVVLIAGKGHENYQIIGDTVIHFNDAETARKHIGKAQSR